MYLLFLNRCREWFHCLRSFLFLFFFFSERAHKQVLTVKKNMHILNSSTVTLVTVAVSTAPDGGFHLCTNQSHAFAIRCTQGKWLLLDSNLSNPVKILYNIPIHMVGGMQLPYWLYKLHGQNPLTLPYMENQEKAFCLVHAFKMALGEQLITGNSVLSHAQDLENCLTGRLNHSWWS